MNTINLGPEYDEKLRGGIREWLEKRHAVSLETSFGLAGSQEISTWRYKVDEQAIEIVAIITTEFPQR